MNRQDNTSVASILTPQELLAGVAPGLGENAPVSLLSRLQNFALDGDDVLTEYRTRITLPMMFTVAVLLLPFPVINYLAGRYLATGATSLVILAVAWDVFKLYRGQPATIPLAMLLVPVAAAMAVAIEAVGMYGALWAYPVMMFCYFVLSRRKALVCASLFLFGTTAMVAHYVGAGMAVRVFASLLLTMLMFNIVLHVMAELHVKLMQQATTDPLTGASNRRQMDIALGELVKRARGRPVPASILLIDIDNFKQINDRHGHGAGDAVLIGMVKLITTRKRTVDSLYRIGGEEFLLLLQETSAAAASNVAEQLRALIEDSRVVRDLAVTISIGITECATGYTPEQWLKAADEALYRAKRMGRNRVEHSTFGDSVQDAGG